MDVSLLNPDKERYEGFAAQYDKDGHITISECSICGYLEWVSAATKEPKGYHVVQNVNNCPKCDEARYRGPELYVWVINVVAKAQKDVAKLVGPATE